MYMILWAGLALNALVHLRIAVLKVQDGVDRVKAGVAWPPDVLQWKEAEGAFYVLWRTVSSPLLSIYKVAKFLLFPRGVKSKFAKEQEAEALEKLLIEANEAAIKAEEEGQAQLRAQTQEYETLIRAWAPGEILFAKPKPEQVALGWHATADVFDAACDLVARTKGQPWSPTPPKRPIAAIINGKDMSFEDE